MSDGKLFKADRDYSKDVDKLLPEAEKLAQVSLVMDIFVIVEEISHG